MIRVISPHYDDAIGSIGGSMAKWIKAGEKVQIITVFTEDCIGIHSDLVDYLNSLCRIENYNERKVENERACHLLNVEYYDLGFIDAIYRTKDGEPIYKQLDELFGEYRQFEQEMVDQIAKRLNTIIDDCDNVFFPASIGGHVDHVIVYESSKQIKCKAPITYYYDFSYEGKPREDIFVEELSFYDEDAFRLKMRSLRCYSTQIDMIFDKYGGIEAYYRDNNICGEGHYYEKIFKKVIGTT